MGAEAAVLRRGQYGEKGAGGGREQHREGVGGGRDAGDRCGGATICASLREIICRATMRQGGRESWGAGDSGGLRD